MPRLRVTSVDPKLVEDRVADMIMEEQGWGQPVSLPEPVA